MKIVNDCCSDPCKKTCNSCNPCGGCSPAQYDCDFDIQADPYDQNKWVVTICGSTHKITIPSIPCIDFTLSTDYSTATLNWSGDVLCESGAITGAQLGELINVDNLRDTEIDYTLDGACYEFIYHKDIECGEGCESPADSWSNWNVNSEDAKQTVMPYIRGATADGCPLYLDKPDDSCSLLIYDKNCEGTEGWQAYTIEDAADDCIMELDDNGYYQVLTKTDCGCIVECNLPAVPAGATTLNFVRDSVPDDADFPWYYGNYNETINLYLEENAPNFFGKYDLKVTVTYGVQAIKSDVYSYNYNWRSLMAPVIGEESTYNAVKYTASILQGWAMAASTSDVTGGIPWGTMSLRGTLVFIVPKGLEACLHHEYRIRTNSSFPDYYYTSGDGQKVPDSDLANVDETKYPASRLNALTVLIEPVNSGSTNYSPTADAEADQLDDPTDIYPNAY